MADLSGLGGPRGVRATRQPPPFVFSDASLASQRGAEAGSNWEKSLHCSVLFRSLETVRWVTFLKGAGGGLFAEPLFHEVLVLPLLGTTLRWPLLLHIFLKSPRVSPLGGCVQPAPQRTLWIPGAELVWGVSDRSDSALPSVSYSNQEETECRLGPDLAWSRIAGQLRRGTP